MRSRSGRMSRLLIAAVALLLPALSQAQQGVCGRTEAVQAAIVAAVPGVTDCAAVTAQQLAAITTLDLSGDIDAPAKVPVAGDFAGLTGLVTLDLSDNGNNLSALPAGILSGLTALRSLDLSDNSLSDLPRRIFEGINLTSFDFSNNAHDLFISVFLYQSTDLRGVRIATSYGTPHALNVNLTARHADVEDGSTTVSATITVPAGTVSHDVPFDALLSGFPAGQKVTVEMAVQTLRAEANGYRIYVSSVWDQTIVLPVPDNVMERGICDRFVVVVERILAAVSGQNCTTVTAAQLASVTTLNFSSRLGIGWGGLQPGDFDGLTGLQTLSIDSNIDSRVPVGIFRGLTSLTTLWMYTMGLSSLQAGHFRGLTSLRTLSLAENRLTRLPAGLFQGLNITRLVLSDNPSAENPQTFSLEVGMAAARDGNGVALFITEGAPHAVTLTLTAGPADGAQGAAATHTFPAGEVFHFIPSDAALLSAFSEGDEVTVQMAVQTAHTGEGYRIETTQMQETTFTMPAAGDEVRIPFVPDVNADEEVNANDALILYYAFSLRSELGNGR